MPRFVHPVLAAHLAGPTTTVCRLLKVIPVAPSQAPIFGICTTNIDVPYDDGASGDGVITYRCRRGYTSFDIATSANMTVDNTVAAGLLAEQQSDGVTAEGIRRGDYDNARFVEYLVNYNDVTAGHHTILNSGRVGQVTNLSELTVNMEFVSLTKVLMQNSVIELTSITDRAKYGDERNKMTLRWYNSAVASIGAETDRQFTMSTVPGYAETPGSATGTVTDVQFFAGDGAKRIGQLVDTSGLTVPPGFVVTAIKLNGVTKTLTTDYTIDTAGLVTFLVLPPSGALGTWSGTLPVYPNGYFVPGVVHWLTGINAGRENELETYDNGSGLIELAIPTREPITVGDTFKIRRDSDKSKTRAIADGNLPNMRAEPELPRADGLDLQSPGSSSSVDNAPLPPNIIGGGP